MTDKEFLEKLWKHRELWPEFKRLLKFYSSNSSKNTDSDKT
jgi:hypothetical protein